jgi:fructose-specific phosphotransferase system component IIB
MREDPTEGEDVTVIVRVEAQGPDGGVGEVTEEAIESAIEDIEATGATVEEELRFGTLRVQTTQETIADLCAVSTLASIETDNTIGLGGDAGEDLGD